MSLNVLIINENLESVSQLSIVLRSIDTGCRIARTSTLEIEESNLSDKELIFVSAKFGTNRVAKFIANLRSLKIKDRIAVIILPGSKEVFKTFIFQYFKLGVDGFLLAPFSVDKMFQVIRLGNELKKQDIEFRRSKGIKVIAKEMVDQFSDIYRLKKIGASARVSQRILAEIKSELLQFSDADLDLYFDYLEVRLQKSEPIKLESRDVCFVSSNKDTQTFSTDLENTESEVLLKDLA